MPNNKYFLMIYGPHATEIMKDHRHLFHNDEKIISEDNTQIVVNNIYPTGLPDRIVWHDNLGLIMHGIVFPKDAGIDELAANPDQVFGNMLREYRDKPYLIPFAILNGSYIGVVIDKINRKVFAFTSFLNSIPLYYALLYDTLILSTSYSKISALLEKSIDHVTYGMIEYYQLGTNISALTPIDEIKTVAKGAYLEFDGYRIVHDFYYKMPLNEESRSFDSWVDEFASLWDKSINGLHSHLFKYGLGLTGGIDSRVILAGIKEKEDVLYFTGAHKDNPDYILAKKITASLGLSEHHILEDYTQSNYSQGYLDYLAISDNPIYNNKVYNLDQLKFRADHHLTFELMGLTEFLGGVYHYTDRRKISNMINMSMPLRMHKLDSNSPDSFMNLAFMGLRNTILNDFQSLLSSEQNLEYKNNLQSAIMFLNQQINSHSTLENYLERFRHIHKMANLLSWNRINGRSYVELLSPSMNIDMTDLAARIPLKYRDNRRILLAYLKRYHQRLSKIVLSGYIFSANAPWCLYKGLSPYIKVLNHLGVNIPILQWYMNPNSKQNFIDQRQIRNIQTHVVNESELIKSFIHESEDVNSINSLKLMRLCNLALLEKRLKSDETTYQTYLLELYAIIK